MTADHLKGLEDFEAELWKIADNLRANSNLASNEYFGVVQPDRIDGRIVSPRFMDAKDDEDYKVVSFFAKRARGAMAGWIVRERIKAPGALSRFDGLGYRYDPARSTPDEPVFLRRTGR